MHAPIMEWPSEAAIGQLSSKDLLHQNIQSYCRVMKSTNPVPSCDPMGQVQHCKYTCMLVGMSALLLADGWQSDGARYQLMP